MLALCLCGAARAADIISATVTLTNASNITGTNGGSITINGDTRTWTNTVHNAATQILVSTNITSDTTRLLIQTTTYPFSGLTIPAYATNSITWRGLSGAAVAVTLSPTNWGSVSYVTNAITSATVIRVPMSVETSTNRAPLANQLLSDLDSYGTVKLWSAFTLSNSTWKGLFSPDAGLGLHGRGLVSTNYTLTTNDLYVGVDTRSNTNLILTLPTASSASNLLFVLKDEGGAGATNTLKIYPQSGDRIDGLTNLAIAANYGSVMLRSRGGTNYATMSTGGGVSGSVSGGGSGTGATEIGFVTLTNGAASVASTNVATNSIIFMTRQTSDGTTQTVNEDCSGRLLGERFQIVSSDAADSARVFWSLVNSGSSSGCYVSADYLAPFAYFRLDDTNIARMTDVVGGRNLTNTVGTITSVAGQITNAFRFSSAVANPEFENGSTNYNFANQDWAMRFWVNLDTYSGGNSLFFDSVPSSNDGFICYFRTADNHVKIRVGHGGSFNNFEFNAAGGITTNTWHRVVLWRKATELGVQIDNGTPETQAMAFTIGDWETFLWNGDQNHAATYDEIAIWKAYVPTAPELLYDWNGGTGRSYPLH